MADLKSTTTLAEMSNVDVTAPRYRDPFGEGSPTIMWTQPLNLAQLVDEVRTSISNAQMVAYLPEDDEGNDVDPDADHPYVFFMAPVDIDVAAVRRVLAAHRPDPYYGMSDEQRQQTQLIAKAKSGATLTNDEIQQALRLLLA